MKFSNLLEYINDHQSRTETHHGWSVVHTKHGKYDHTERHGGELPGGNHEFVGKVAKKLAGIKNPRSGEFMYHSVKHNQAAMLNIDHEKKQMRVITVLPKGRSVPKPGTQKFMVEGVEQDIECVVLYDTEFDEAMDQFVNEELGMSLDAVLEESKRAVPGNEAWKTAIEKAKASGEKSASMLYNSHQNVPKRHFHQFATELGANFGSEKFEKELLKAKDSHAKNKKPEDKKVSESVNNPALTEDTLEDHLKAHGFDHKKESYTPTNYKHEERVFKLKDHLEKVSDKIERGSRLDTYHIKDKKIRIGYIGLRAPYQSWLKAT